MRSAKSSKCLPFLTSCKEPQQKRTFDLPTTQTTSTDQEDNMNLDRPNSTDEDDDQVSEPRWRCKWCLCSGKFTPALRKGPSGPKVLLFLKLKNQKTLCNACGVYYNRNGVLPPHRENGGLGRIPSSPQSPVLSDDKKIETCIPPPPVFDQPQIQIPTPHPTPPIPTFKIPVYTGFTRHQLMFFASINAAASSFPIPILDGSGGSSEEEGNYNDIYGSGRSPTKDLTDHFLSLDEMEEDDVDDEIAQSMKIVDTNNYNNSNVYSRFYYPASAPSSTLLNNNNGLVDDVVRLNRLSCSSSQESELLALSADGQRVKRNNEVSSSSSKGEIYFEDLFDETGDNLFAAKQVGDGDLLFGDEWVHSLKCI